MIFLPFELPLPPSANSLFANHPRTHGRFPTREYVVWKNEAGRILEIYKRKFPFAIESRKTKWVISYNIYLPKNKIWKSDVDNRIKPLNDIFCKIFELDDRYLMEVHANKFEGDERVVAELDILD